MKEFLKINYMQLKSIIAVLLFGAVSLNSNGQQIFTLSQYTQHNFIINPAASGANEQGSVGVSYRKMWQGIDGGPQTTILFADKYFAKKKTGVSIALYDDKTGPTARTGGQVGVSYSVDLEKGRRIQFGLGGQVLQYSINKSEVTNSSYFDLGDSYFLNGPGSLVRGDASAGIYYRSNTFNAGIAAQQLIQSKLEFIKGTSSENQGSFSRHYFLTADYKFQVDEDNVVIPSTMFKYLPNSPLDFELGARLEHKNILWVGFGYYVRQSYTAYAGLKIKNALALGYAYQEYNTPLSAFDKGSGSHELSLRYFLK